MEFTVDELGDVRAIRITGNLDTKTAPAAQKQLIQLIDNGATKILVDVGYLAYITSSGLRILLVAAKRLKGTDGELRICNPNTVVRDVMMYSGFLDIFKVYKSQAEALVGF